MAKTKQVVSKETRKQQLEAVLAAVDEKNEKSVKAGRRAKRRLNYILAFDELMQYVPKGTELSETTKQVYEQLNALYTPGVQIEVSVGMTLVEFLEKNKDVKDCYKKLLKWCDKNSAKIDGMNIVEA